MLNTTAQQIKQVLSQFSDLQLVILFGSCANGAEQINSDVDIAVQAKYALSADLKMQMIERLSAKLKRPIDLIDITSIGQPLLGEIITKGKRLYGSVQSYGQLINKSLLENADFLPYRQRILTERRRKWLDQ